MAVKKAAPNKSAGRVPVRKAAGAKKPVRWESWMKVFERNLILVGYSPEEAKELVEIAAS